ncbi:MAG: UbiX family flavin prenyltransferase [Deltaproteobacteria bacterium]|nr:UbiX family flavin prenyltransferase [Deltaproteobacteria bacterium]
MIVVGITGTSGVILGIRLVEELLRKGEAVAGVVSTRAWSVMVHELSFRSSGKEPLREFLMQRGRAGNLERFCEYDDKNLFAPMASGSSGFEAVVVMPCSMKTLSAIATGFSDTLITRACDVALKEKRRCLLVPRESPLSLIHLENLKRVAQAGAAIVPPVPAFYFHPKSINDVIDFVVGKVLSQLGREHELNPPWSSFE